MYDNENSTVNWREQTLYGSSRLGTWLPNTRVGQDSSIKQWDTVGYKQYELNNHLGNVMVTVTDKRLQHSTNGTAVDYYQADVATAQEYYSFGALMPARTYPATGKVYRYGFNGKENDNEVKGVGNEQDYGMRIYDPRVGRFMSVDPIEKNYPWYTPYSFAGNKPIENIDLDGEEEFHFTLITGKDGNAYFKPTSLPILNNDHNWFGGLIKFSTKIEGQRYTVNYGGNTYYIGFAEDKGRTNNYKVPLFKQFLNHPTNVKLFTQNFDTEKQSGLKGFLQDMQVSVAATVMAHQVILEGQQSVANSEVPNLREGSSPELKAYGGPGGGHHVPAKKAFDGAVNYNMNEALAIPNTELQRLNIDHGLITGAQMKGYKAFAATGAPLTWEAMETIETNALIKGGMKAEAARATVSEAVNSLKKAGVKAPTKIPWGGK